MKISINLNMLMSASNRIWGETDLIQFDYMDDNELCITKGDFSIYTNNANLNDVLYLNGVDLKNGKQVYDVLAKHLANQLSATLGRKLYPEIAGDGSSILK